MKEMMHYWFSTKSNGILFRCIARGENVTIIRDIRKSCIDDAAMEFEESLYDEQYPLSLWNITIKTLLK